MHITKWGPLQLFAEGGAAGDGSAQGTATGDTGAAAGHRGLQGTPAPAAVTKERAYPAQPGQQVAAAETQAQRRMSWDEIKADPEYSKEMQNMVQQRLKKSKAAEENLSKLTPALEIMAKAYGLDPENPDYDALTKAVTEDTRLQGKQPEESPQAREQVLQQHYQSLLRQSRDLQKKYPGFDLRQELKNPVFVRLTAPHVGISAEDAYYTVHRGEISKAAVRMAAQKAAQRISNAIHSGSSRPQENGTSAHAPSVTAFDYRNASREQREALKQRIRQAGARGEKIYPGDL